MKSFYSSSVIHNYISILYICLHVFQKQISLRYNNFKLLQHSIRSLPLTTGISTSSLDLYKNIFNQAIIY